MRRGTYPNRVRAMVLESVVDHSATSARSFIDAQASAAQDSFDLARHNPDMRYPGQLIAVSMCLGMPPADNPQHRLKVRGLDEPILLANAIHDPATGYNWAQTWNANSAGRASC